MLPEYKTMHERRDQYLNWTMLAYIGGIALAVIIALCQT